MQPQDYKVWVGAELLGCTRGYQKKVLNAVTYFVKGVVDGQVQLSMATEFRGEMRTRRTTRKDGRTLRSLWKTWPP